MSRADAGSGPGLDLVTHLSDCLRSVKTTITQFQRAFREARAAADRGESVIIEADGKTYVFEVMAPPRNPFEGLKGVFGSVSLGKKKGTHREQIRARLAAKRSR